MANKVIKTILERTSTRQYNNKKIPLSKVMQIAEAGKMAPSAMNRQIANILVVRSKRKVENLRNLAVKEMNRDVFYGASTMLLVHAPRDDKFCLQDCSLVLGNMFLAAEALKISSCWINQVDDLFATKEGTKLKKKFGIPEDNRVVGTCILGYSDVHNEIKKRKEDFIKVI